MEPLLTKTPSTDLSKLPDRDARFLDYYRIYRGQVEHEDNLVGSRISWFVTSQSFLFSAFAIIAGGIQTTTAQGALESKHVLLVLIPSLAIATSILILLAILSGVAAMHKLRQEYAAVRRQTDDSLLPPLQGSQSTRATGIAAPLLLPMLFMAVWVFLLMRRLF